MRQVISVSGWINSGKDTVGNYLVSEHGFTKLSFASTVKDVLSAMFSWDRKMLEGDTAESREQRTKVDTWWANRLGIPHFTPRWALQNVGTEVLRNHFHDEIWIAALEHRIEDCKTSIVITDCRFPNEVRALQNLQALMVRVKRGVDPNWVEDAVWAARGDGLSIKIMKELGIHETEWAWLTTKFNVIIHNNVSLQELYNQVNKLVLPSTVTGSSQLRVDN